MYLLGADPEVFVKNKLGQLVSGFGLIAGTKKQPAPVDRGAVQVDGMALEFNINPAATKAEFSLNIQTVLAQLKALVPDHDIAIQAVAHFGQEYMATQPEEALELGCDPDFNAYTGRTNDRPNGDRPFRTAAGHVHIGWSNGEDVMNPDHRRDCEMVIRQMDYYLGVPSLLLDPDDERRQLYGAAGAYRPKPYGCEYRVLSNFWLKSPELIDWVYTQTMAALSALEHGDIAPNCEDIINNSDKETAKAIVAQNKWVLPCTDLQA